MPRHFLLSPANCAGQRAQLLLQGRGLLATRLQSRDGAPLGELCAFLSSLYFRGKLAYAQAFAGPDRTHVITTHRGLLPPETRITLAEFRAMAEVPIDLAETRYVAPLEATAREQWERAGQAGEMVLLGSIATGKYVDCLLPVFGEALLFPADFIGRGDMSRGGLLLRQVRERRELEYIPVGQTDRRGRRPPRLQPPSGSPANQKAR
jgi:hypothetical protein